MLETMEAKDWLTVIAIIVGPILAVQAQKWIERSTDDNRRKLHIFKTLMATRATSLSNDHVQALNLIDLEFRGEKYKSVTGAWKTYIDHLENYPTNDESRGALWSERRFDLLTILLIKMGESLGYEIDEVDTKKRVYSPKGHTDIENEQASLRKNLNELIEGNRTLKVSMAGNRARKGVSTARAKAVKALKPKT